MQDERRIVIEVVDRATPSPERPRPKPEDQTPAGEAVDQTGKSDALLLGKSIFYNQMFQQARNQVQQLVGNSINRYFQMREDYKGEQSYKNAMTIIGKGIGGVGVLVAAAKSMAAAGTVGGFIGASVGAAGMIIGWGLTEAINGTNRIMNAKISLNNQEYESAFQRSRAGLMDGGRGTRG